MGRNKSAICRLIRPFRATSFLSLMDLGRCPRLLQYAPLGLNANVIALSLLGAERGEVFSALMVDPLCRAIRPLRRENDGARHCSADVRSSIVPPLRKS